MRKRKLVKYLVAVCVVVFAGICLSNTSLVSAEAFGETGSITIKITEPDFVNDLEMTDAEIESAYFGVWYNDWIEDSITITKGGYLISGYGKHEDLDWTYKGVKILKDRPISIDRENDVIINGDVKALHFSTKKYDYYVARGYSLDCNKSITLTTMKKDTLKEVATYYYNERCFDSEDNLKDPEYVKAYEERSDFEFYLTVDDPDSVWRIDRVLAAAKGAKGIGSSKNDYSYTTKKGDTLSNIATNFYGTNLNRYKIKEYNAAAFKKTGGKLVEGMELKIPAKIGSQERLPEIALAKGEKIYTVKEGDTLWIIAKQFYGNGEKYKELFNRNADRITKVNRIYAGQEIVVPAK